MFNHVQSQVSIQLNKEVIWTWDRILWVKKSDGNRLTKVGICYLHIIEERYCQLSI